MGHARKLNFLYDYFFRNQVTSLLICAYKAAKQSLYAPKGYFSYHVQKCRSQWRVNEMGCSDIEAKHYQHKTYIPWVTTDL